jgi:MFS superfamily sulfate permease-like transporter
MMEGFAKNMFEFQVTLTDEDYLQFNVYHMLNGPDGKRSLLFTRLVVPMICFLTVLTSAYSDPELAVIEAVILTIISVLWVIFSKKILAKSMKDNVNRMRKNGKLPYSAASIIKFDDACVHEITPDTETKTRYSAIEKIYDTEKAVYLFYSSLQAYILPANTFSNEAEKMRLMSFLHVKTGK